MPTDTVTLPEYLQGLHRRSTRLAGICAAIAELETHGECGEGQSALIYIARELAEELDRALDSVNLPEGAA